VLHLFLHIETHSLIFILSILIVRLNANFVFLLHIHFTCIQTNIAFVYCNYISMLFGCTATGETVATANASSQAAVSKIELKQGSLSHFKVFLARSTYRN